MAPVMQTLRYKWSEQGNLLLTQWWTTVRSYYLVIWLFSLFRLDWLLIWYDSTFLRLSAGKQNRCHRIKFSQLATKLLFPQPVKEAGAGQGLRLSVFINGPCRGEWRQGDLRNDDGDGVLSPSESASGTYIFMTCYLLEPARAYLFNNRPIRMLTKAEPQHNNYSAGVTLTSQNVFRCNLHLHRGWV